MGYIWDRVGITPNGRFYENDDDKPFNSGIAFLTYENVVHPTPLAKDLFFQGPQKYSNYVVLSLPENSRI